MWNHNVKGGIYLCTKTKQKNWARNFSVLAGAISDVSAEIVLCFNLDVNFFYQHIQMVGLSMNKLISDSYVMAYGCYLNKLVWFSRFEKVKKKQNIGVVIDHAILVMVTSVLT